MKSVHASIIDSPHIVLFSVDVNYTVPLQMYPQHGVPAGAVYGSGVLERHLRSATSDCRKPRQRRPEDPVHLVFRHFQADPTNGIRRYTWRHVLSPMEGTPYNARAGERQH